MNELANRKIAKKLTNIDLHRILERLRNVDTQLLQHLAPIVWHLRWQENHIKALEEDLRLLRVRNMFENKEVIAKRDKEIHQRTLERGIENNDPQPDIGEWYHSLCMNLEDMGRYLKLGGKTREELIKKANEWAKANGKELLPVPESIT